MSQIGRWRDYVMKGTTAARPDPTATAVASLYCNTTTNTIQRNTGAAWEDVSAVNDIQALLDTIGSTQGQVLYRNASDWVALNPGTSGQFLKTQGAAANPIWDDASGGVLTNAGHPQGAVSAAAGSLCRDTTNNRLYIKLGGASTAYGWYPLQPYMAASPPYMHIWMQPAETTALGGAGSNLGVLGFSLSTGQNSVVTHQDSVHGVFRQFQTTAADGSVSYIGGSGSVVNWWDYDFDIVAVIKTGANVSDVRIWGVALTTAAIADAAAMNTGSYFAIGHRTPDGDTGWHGFTQAGSGNLTVSAQIAAIATDTVYKLRIRFIRSGTPTAYFSVNDGTEISQTANIPATGATSFVISGLVSKAAAAKVWRHKLYTLALG